MLGIALSQVLPMVAGVIGLMILLIWLSRRFGGGVWLIVFILIPASLMLIGAEIQAAWGALAIVVGSITGAMIMAGAICATMLVGAHFIAAESLREQEKAGSYNTNSARLYKESLWKKLGKWWKGKSVSFRYGFFFFLLSSLAFISLCFIRSLAVSIFLGSALGILGGVPFLFYPVVSFALGYLWALAFRSCLKAGQRFRQIQMMMNQLEMDFKGMPAQDVQSIKKAIVAEFNNNGESPDHLVRKYQEYLSHLKVHQSEEGEYQDWPERR